LTIAAKRSAHKMMGISTIKKHHLVHTQKQHRPHRNCAVIQPTNDSGLDLRSFQKTDEEKELYSENP